MMTQTCRAKWTGTMTDRARFNHQMDYRPVDRCFNMEFGYWNENFSSWPLFVDNGVTNIFEAHAFFGFDKILTVAGNVWLSPTFEEVIVEETSNHIIRMNPDGLLAEVLKSGADTIPHYIQPSIVTPDDWNKCKEERLNRDDPSRLVNVSLKQGLFQRGMTSRYGGVRNVDVDSIGKGERDYPLGVYCGSMIGRIRDMLTFEGLAYAIYDYPDMVEDMVETSCLLLEDFLDQVLGKVDFDFASGWEDICFKNGPIVSVDFFKNVVMPRYKRIRRKLDAAGVKLWYTDCDGDVRSILPCLIEGGINCLFPFEVNGCTHPKELLDEYDGVLRIMGGVDKMELAKGPEAIKAYLKTLTPLVERGGYIPLCDHHCPPNVKPEDYLYYLDLKQRMFGVPT